MTNDLIDTSCPRYWYNSNDSKDPKDRIPHPIVIYKRITLQDLESLVGLMVCCTRAIASSLAFLQHFYDLITSVHNKNKTYHFVRVNKEVKEDVKVWLNLLEHFNRVILIPEQCWISNEAIIDSSGNNQLGCGAYYFGHWGVNINCQIHGKLPYIKRLDCLRIDTSSFRSVYLGSFIWKRKAYIQKWQHCSGGHYQ